MARGNSRAQSEAPSTSGKGFKDQLTAKATKADVKAAIAMGDAYSKSNSNAREDANFNEAKEFATKAKALLDQFDDNGKFIGKGNGLTIVAESRSTGRVESEYKFNEADAAIYKLSRMVDKTFAVAKLWNREVADSEKAIMSPKDRKAAIKKDEDYYYANPAGLSPQVVAIHREIINERAALGAGLQSGGLDEKDIKKMSVLSGLEKGNREIQRLIRDMDDAAEYGVRFKAI